MRWMTNGYGKNPQYDGFYAVCISLDESPGSHYSYKPTTLGNRRILSANEDGIQGTVSLSFPRRPYTRPFPDMFLSLTLYRLLEKKLGNSYTPRELIHTLQDMNFLQLPIDDYVPAYTRTEITDAIQNAFGFRNGL